MVLTAEQELAKAKEEYEKAKAQAKARYDKIKARHTTAARKLDTRRKIIVGGALIEMAGRDAEAARLLSRVIDSVKREQDRKAFEGWDVPSPSSGSDGNGESDSARSGQAGTGDASQQSFADRYIGRENSQ